MLEGFPGKIKRREEMIKKKTAERRLHPRINHQLPIDVAANGYAFSTQTLNVSCVGTYCHIEKYIPPFTRVMVKLNLPAGRKKQEVECKGVIVRTEDETDGGFNIAIFFNDIKDNQREKITHYLDRLLAQTSSSPNSCS